VSCSIASFLATADDVGLRGRRTSSRVRPHPSRRETTISPCVPSLNETRKWVSRIKARSRPVEVQRVVKVVEKSDLASKEVKARVGRSRHRVWDECCIYAATAICIDVSGLDKLQG